LFQPIRPRRVTEEIVRQMVDRIAQGAVKAGERFPPEREMAQQLGVSRPSLREAIQVLEHLGMVRSVQGDGTYALDVGAAALQDPLRCLILDSSRGVVDLAEFRTAMESWAAGVAARRMEPGDLKSLREILEEMAEGLASGKGIHHLDAEFHLALARATQNTVYFHVAGTIFHLFAEVTRLSHEQIFPSRGDQERLLQEHRGILDAMERKDAEAARRRMRLHLARTEEWFRRHLQGEAATRSAQHGAERPV
jgi:GntR family transcriptional repressor for pyruvate dehydrogenase complex